jgi:hypothetical protein
MPPLTQEQRDLLKSLQAQQREAKKESEGAKSDLFGKVFNAVNPDEIFNLMGLVGSQRVSQGIELEDGRKLTCTFIDSSKS